MEVRCVVIGSIRVEDQGPNWAATHLTRSIFHLLHRPGEGEKLSVENSRRYKARPMLLFPPLLACLTQCK